MASLQSLNLIYSLGIAVFSGGSVAGGFYLLTNWRIKELETRVDKMQNIGERLARIEAQIEILIQNQKS